MDYIVYILYSQKRSRYYVGQTTDIEKRMKKHNQGNVPSTKGGRPWELVLQTRVSKRSAKRYLDNYFGVQYFDNARHELRPSGLQRVV